MDSFVMQSAPHSPKPQQTGAMKDLQPASDKSLALGAIIAQTEIQLHSILNGLTVSQQCTSVLPKERPGYVRRIINLDHDSTPTDTLDRIVATFVGDDVGATCIMNVLAAADCASLVGISCMPYRERIRGLIARMSNDSRLQFFASCRRLMANHPSSHLIDETLQFVPFKCDVQDTATTDVGALHTALVNVHNSLCFELLRQPKKAPGRVVLVLEGLFADQDEAALVADMIEKSFAVGVERVSKLDDHADKAGHFVYLSKNSASLEFATAVVEGGTHALLPRGSYSLCGYANTANFLDQNAEISLTETLKPTRGTRSMHFQPVSETAAPAGGATQLEFPEFVLNKCDVIFAREAPPAAFAPPAPAPITPTHRGSDPFANLNELIDTRYEGRPDNGTTLLGSPPRTNPGHPNEQYTNLFTGMHRTSTTPGTIQNAPSWGQPFVPKQQQQQQQEQLAEQVPSWAIPNQGRVDESVGPYVPPVFRQSAIGQQMVARQNERFGTIPLSEFDKIVQSALISLTDHRDIAQVNAALRRMLDGSTKSKLALEADLGRACDAVREWRGAIKPADTKSMRKSCAEGVTRGRLFSSYFEFMSRKTPTGDSFIVLITTACIVQSQSSLMTIRDGDPVNILCNV